MTTECPTCATPSPVSFTTTDRNRHVGNERFTYHACPECGTVFIAPLPEDLGRYYRSDYYDIPSSSSELAERAVADRHKLEVVSAFATSGRLLEIGPAFGYFSFLAKEAGFTVEAIEMDARCSHFLRDAVGIRVENTADTVSALGGLEPFDVIALWHVVEHLPDPWGTLAAAAGRLRPGGVLVIAAPNPEAFQFRILRGLWTHVDAPRHVRLIPMRTLRRRLAEVGLIQVHATTSDTAARGWDWFGWEMSLFGLPPRNSRLRRLLHPLLRLLTRVDHFSGRGSTYTMVFRREFA